MSYRLCVYDQGTLEIKLNNVLKMVQIRLQDNKLTVNGKKRKYIIITSHNNLNYTNLDLD